MVCKVKKERFLEGGNLVWRWKCKMGGRKEDMVGKLEK